MRRKFVTPEEFKKLAQAGAVEGLAVRKQYVAEVKQAEEPRVLEFTISTGDVDRDQDTIDPAGWRLDNYLRNPVVLFAHDYQAPPVARSLAVWVEGGKLKSKAEFTPPELYPFGNLIYEMYRQGFMRAASVGFLPLKWSFTEDRKYGIDFAEQELLEWSCVPVPANPSALVDAKAKGLDLRPLVEWATRVLDEWTEEKGVWVPRRALEQVVAALQPKRFGVPDLESLVGKGAVSYQDAHPNGAPKADEDRAWDADAAVARVRRWASSDGSGEKETIDWPKYRKAFTWYDSENPENFGSYKLPHHDVIDGRLTTVWRGVAAAMAALLGARGGVDIPEDDRRAVYNHLARHYEEYDKEPPEFRAYVLDDPAELLALVRACWGIEAEPEAKAGRVLSRANEDRIRQAVALLNEVLAQLDEEPEEPDASGGDDGKSDLSAARKADDVLIELADDEAGDEGEPKVQVDEEALREMVGLAVREALLGLTGRVD